MTKFNVGDTYKGPLLIGQHMTLNFWINTWLLHDTLAGQRVGQSYMNRVRPDLVCIKLFNETCVDNAWCYIKTLEGENK